MKREQCAEKPRQISRDRYLKNSKMRQVLALLHSVIRGFLGNHDVVNVTLAKARGGDTNEAALFGEFSQSLRPGITHAALQSAHELVR
jgi:hypothetical protein